MKLFTTFLTLFLSLATLFAANDWYHQTPTNVGEITFLDNQKMVAVGQGAWYSDDFGASWTGVPTNLVYENKADDGGSSTFYFLRSVHFSGPAGYAVGDNGYVLRSVNNGRAWKKQTLPLPHPLYNLVDVHVFDLSNVIIMANENKPPYTGIIFKSSDGGNTWSKVMQEEDAIFRTVDFTDESTGWASSFRKKVFKTTNAGDTWTKINLPESISSDISYDLDFVDANNGIISLFKMNQIVRTNDGGANWQIIETGIDGYSHDIKYFSTGIAYMLGEDKLYRSSNHGQTWALDTEFLDEGRHKKMTFKNPSIGIVYDGNDGSSSSGFRYNHTRNGGTDWHYNHWKPSGIHFLDQNYGWSNLYDETGTTPGILRTKNGITWSFVPTTSDIGIVKGYNSLQFLNNNLGYSFATEQVNSTTNRRVLAKTSDGGSTWTSLGMTDHSLTYMMMDYYFVNEQYGWVVYSNGKIFKTLDNGLTWGPQSSGVSNYLSDVFFVDENVGWISGYSGVLLRTINGGLLWNKVDMGEFSDVNIYAVKFYDAKRGYAIGRRNSDGLVLKTADGGNTWMNITPSDLPGFLYGNQIEVQSPNSVYLLSYDYIRKTSDSGNSWQKIEYNSGNNSTNTFSVINDSRIYVQSDGITFSDKANMPATVHTELYTNRPETIALQPNYPNPFNPVTNIEFSIKTSGNYELAVYSIDGRLIKRLATGAINAGNYKVQFDGSQQPSGLYMAVLTGPELRMSRKMILVK